MEMTTAHPRTDDSTTGVMSTVWDRLSRRAWSRAGAVAAVVSRGPTRRVLGFSTRLALLVAGSVTIAAAVSVTLWNDLGPGPLDVFINGLVARTGLPLTLAVWATVASLIVAASVLGRRPGFGTLLSPLLVGPALQVFVTVLDRWDPPGSMLVRIPIHLAAVAVIGVGAGALIVSGLGAGSGELLAGAASDRVGHAESRVRPLFELTWLTLGIALGGPFGVGTVLVAVFVGPAVANGYRVVDQLAAHSRRGLIATHEAIVAREVAREAAAVRAR